MDGDRLAGLVALGEVVALEHARDGVLRGELDHVRASCSLPSQRELKSTWVRLAVEDLEDLRLVGAGVGLDLLGRERRARGVAAGRVADQPGEVADEEDDAVPELLELAHLVQQHRVAEVQIRARSGRSRP